MTKLTPTRSVALALAVAVSTLALAPAVQAQDRGPGRSMDNRHEMRGEGRGSDHGMRPGMRGDMGMRGDVGMRRGMGGHGLAGILAFNCSPRSAEALELGLVRLSYRLDLTDEQKPLFDALRSSALTAQTSLADECAAQRPAADTAASSQATPSTATPDPVGAIRNRLAIDSARIAAVESVLPDFEALVNSLSDEQTAGLGPQRGRMGEMRGERGRHFGQRDDRPGMRGPHRQRPGAEGPAAPMTPQAPAPAPQG
jgi:hypothetical protein